MRPRIRHPIPRLREVIVHCITRLFPVALSANLGFQRGVAQIGSQIRRVGIGVACQDEVNIIRSSERAQNVVVAE